MDVLSLENETMTVKDFMERTWQMYKETPHINHPGWWRHNTMKVIEELISEEEGEPSQLEKFENAIGSITRCWWNNYKTWEITSFETLYDKSSRLKNATYQMSFCTDLLMSVTSYWASYCALGDLTPEVFLPSLTIKPTSTYSTIVHGQTDPADASGKKRSASEAFKEMLERSGSSGNSASTTGMTTSYISFSENGDPFPPKFGLTEKYRDYRLVVSKKPDS